MTVDDTQWAEVHWNCKEQDTSTTGKDIDGDDDVFVYESEENPAEEQFGDWTGVERDRRLAYLIIGALRPEGLLST